MGALYFSRSFPPSRSSFADSNSILVTLPNPLLLLREAPQSDSRSAIDNIHNAENSNRHDSCQLSNVRTLLGTRFYCPVLETGAKAMSISRFVPPLDYLQTASRTSLQSFELARLNHAANLRREIAVLMDRWIQETSEATLARWMIDHYDSLHNSPQSASETPSVFQQPALDLLPAPVAPPPNLVCAPPRFSHPHRRPGEPAARKPHKHRSAASD